MEPFVNFCQDFNIVIVIVVIVEPDRAQTTRWSMWIACWITKASSAYFLNVQ